MSSASADQRQRVAILGPGRLGFTLALRYVELGADVQLIGRRTGAWQALAEQRGVHTHIAPRALEIPSLAGLQVLVFCVPDDALRASARDWAQACAALEPPRLVLHTSGAADLEVLHPWQVSLQAATHPMRVISGLALQGASSPGTELEHELEAAPVSVFGSDANATELACAEVAAWGAEAIAFDSSADRRCYHLACCLAANHLTALLAWAEQLAGPALGASAARRGLVSLAASAVRRVQEQGPAAALTGPVARGDAATIQAHIDALSSSEAERYRALLPELLGLACESGRLSAERAREFEGQFDLFASEREKKE
jgi:predicted short-subunit dehydrogenase-like oxidoreductase (DUF2520 family)